MGLNGGAVKYPWLFTGTLVAMVVVSPPFALLVTNCHASGSFRSSTAFRWRACSHSGWRLKFLPESSKLAAAYAFFIWFSVFNLFVVSVFRWFMADIWRLDQAKRLFGFIGVGGTLGALACSEDRELAREADRQCESALPLDRPARGRGLQCAPSRRHPSHRCGTAWTKRHAPGGRHLDVGHVAWLEAHRQPELSALDRELHVHYGLDRNVPDYQQGKLVDLTIHDRDVRTGKFANIEFWVQLGTVLIQFLLTARLIRWFGITFALISQPAIAVLGWIALSLAMIYGPWLGARGFTVGQLAPELAVLAGVQILLRISNFATAQPAREALYTVVEREVSLQVGRASSTRSSIASAIALGPGRSWASKPSVRASRRSRSDHSDCGRVGLRGTFARPQAARAHGWSASECEQRRRRSRSSGDGSVKAVAANTPARAQRAEKLEIRSSKCKQIQIFK